MTYDHGEPGALLTLQLEEEERRREEEAKDDVLPKHIFWCTFQPCVIGWHTSPAEREGE